MSSFSGIQRALTGLQAQRAAMDITGQNIANANTPGYTRQRVDLQALEATGAVSLHGIPRQVGDGVGIITTTRVSDVFLDAKVHRQTVANADLGKRAETISSVERLLSEPGATGLSAKLDTMWAAWSTASTATSNNGAKAIVLTSSQAVVDALATGATEVSDLWNQQRDQLDTMVEEINVTSTSVAELNDRINQTVAAGGSPNDLLDRRDQLVTRLVELTGATAEAGPRGTVNVSLSGQPLVNGSDAWEVKTADPMPGSIEGVKGPGVAAPGVKAGLSWLPRSGGDPQPVATSGEMGAALVALNETLPDALRSFDAVAVSLATAVNLQQAKGRDATGAVGSDLEPVFGVDVVGAAFTAKSIRVFITEPEKLALAAPGMGTLDGSNGALIAKIATQRASGAVLDGPNAAWSKEVVRIGSLSSAAKTSATTAASSLTRAVADQQSSAGVSLDEETANLLMMQRAYEGAARVMTAVDQALDTLINRTGLVGR